MVTSNVHHTSTSVALLSPNDVNTLSDKGACFHIQQLHTSDPKLCQGYNTCYSIGYKDGYNEAQNGISPAYACVGHSAGWCSYNFGFLAGNGGINIFYGQSSDQSASLNDRGDNNKISFHQENDNQLGDDGLKSSGGVLPNCDFVFEFRYKDQVALAIDFTLIYPLWE